MTTRRTFLQKMAGITAAGTILQPVAACAAADQSKKIGIALVGLGNYSKTMLGPALKEASNCYLAGIVTGTPSKAEEWMKQYDIPKENVYNYDNFDTINRNKSIDVVYIVLPNSMHAPFTIRALQAGKHVICEKPMAMNAVEARQMIAAAQKAGKKLSIGYRMHYDPFFREVKRLGQEELLGPVNYMECALGYVSAPEKGSWKLKRSMGGGPLLNLGVYPIQSARYTKGKDPVWVTAQASTKRKEIFQEVDEMFTWQFGFADGTLCNSYAGSIGGIDRLYAACTKGHIVLEPATNYTGQAGKSSLGPFNFEHVFQQRLQIEDFAQCVISNKESIVAGETGLKDMIILDAIQEAAKTGRKVEIAW